MRDFTVEANLLKIHCTTNITYSVGQPISINVTRFHILHPRATYLQQESLSRGPKRGKCRVSRVDADLLMPMQTFTEISI
jgi:hypothetical protein